MAAHLRSAWSSDGERIGHRFSGRVDPDRLGGRELMDGIHAGLASRTTVAEPAERGDRRDGPVGVDPDDADINPDLMK